MCEYCDDKGEIETDNNGPIVKCPVCKGKKPVMKFSITNHGGQFQYWHMDCDKGSHEKPMHKPKVLKGGFKEFKCVACNRVGRVLLPKITIGNGELEIIQGIDQ